MSPFNRFRQGQAGKRFLSLLWLLMAAIIVASCAGNNPEQAPPSPTPDSAPSASPTPEPTPTPPPFTYPLTGVGTDQEASARPMMIMVENSPQARPQTGLDQADIVFEILAEGEITRFAAIYQSQEAEVIGPVRSIRPYYVEIGEGLDALIVHAGWSQDAINMIKSRRLAHFDQVYGDDRYYWRSSERSMPNNLYTSVEKIRQGAEDKNYREDWEDPELRFGKVEQVVGEDFTRVEIPYLHGYKVAYDYNEQEQLLMRSMAGEPHLDHDSEEQLSASNVLIVEAEHRILDSVGRRSVSLLGSGKGYLLQLGKYREVQWERTNGIIRAYDNGRELELIPGQTWIQVVPIGTAVSFENADEEAAEEDVESADTVDPTTTEDQ